MLQENQIIPFNTKDELEKVKKFQFYTIIILFLIFYTILKPYGIVFFIDLVGFIIENQLE